jgi:hypothetical protein
MNFVHRKYKRSSKHEAANFCQWDFYQKKTLIKIIQKCIKIGFKTMLYSTKEVFTQNKVEKAMTHKKIKLQQQHGK